MRDVLTMLEQAEANIDPAVRRKMTVSLLTVPEFSPHIKAEDLDDFEERDRKMLLAMSMVEQKMDYSLLAQQINNRQNRLLEAELIRIGMQLSQYQTDAKADITDFKRGVQEELGRFKTATTAETVRVVWYMSVIKWSSVTILAGLIAAIAKRWTEKLWP